MIDSIIYAHNVKKTKNMIIIFTSSLSVEFISLLRNV